MPGGGPAVSHDATALPLPAPPHVEAILYSEFDVKLGPQLVHQSPAGFFSKDQFGEVDKYLISKPEFDGKVRACAYLRAPAHVCVCACGSAGVPADHRCQAPARSPFAVFLGQFSPPCGCCVFGGTLCARSCAAAAAAKCSESP
jgi:hypothetical protein